MATTVRELRREKAAKSKTKVRLYNPDNQDVTVKYGGKDYTIKAGEIETYSYFIGQHIKRHLINHIMAKHPGKGYLIEEEWRKVIDIVEVDL